jgi:DNA-binding XRE family transcriptional regulator
MVDPETPGGLVQKLTWMILRLPISAKPRAGLLVDIEPDYTLANTAYRQRMKLGISQEDFADQVGLDRTYVSGIERGIRNPTLLVLLRLAQVLGVPVAELLEGGDGETE